MYGTGECCRRSETNRAARLWEERGNVDAALRALQRRLQVTGAIGNPPAYLREECRLAIRGRRRDLAQTACDRFLTLKSDPEPAVRPQVEQIRTLYQEFQAVDH